MRFASILGQIKANTLLNRALDSGRLAHAYLFAGPDGVGKTTLALDLAANLLCRKPRADGPCDACPGCVKFHSGNHPDFTRIRPEGATIKIDQIRGLKKALSYSPFESERRVVLIEEVQTMRREAANSLLKLLEEPPPDNLLVLISNTTGGLLDTLVSRCQVIPFSPLPIDVASAIILQHRPELSAADAHDLAALTEGCPGQALALEAETLLPYYHRLIDAVLADYQGQAARIETALLLAAELVECKDGDGMLLTLLRIFYKNAMAAQTAPASAAFSEQVMRARERWNLQQLSAKMSAIDLMEQALARNCNRGLTIEVLLLDLLDGSPSTLS